jgi:hypothetical protein
MQDHLLSQVVPVPSNIASKDVPPELTLEDGADWWNTLKEGVVKSM